MEMQNDKQDLSAYADVLRDMVIALNAFPRSRYLALAITDLESAQHWLHDARESAYGPQTRGPS